MSHSKFSGAGAMTGSSQTLGIKSIRDLELQAKTVFMRLDFNVPLSLSQEPSTKGQMIVEDDTRIRESLPTIRYAIEKGARLILASHLGRPGGKRKMEFSMEAVGHHLAGLLGQEVTLANDCIGEGIELMVKSLKNGQILLLENLRFYPGEEENSLDFAKQLARLAEVYVTDAFATAHRAHASTYGVPSLISDCAMGFLIEKEMQFLNPLLHGPKKPFYAVLGGAKVSDKIKTIAALIQRVNGLLIGGAMGNAFWVAQGKTLPTEAKQPKSEEVEAARSLLHEMKNRELVLILPLDMHQGFDIGPQTIQKFSEVLAKAETIFWNGPLGWFEKPEYSKGTFEIARFIAKTPAIKIAGGGDTISAIHQAGVADGFQHLSTGGGAVLEFLEGNGLPGIDVLKKTEKRSSEKACCFKE